MISLTSIVSLRSVLEGLKWRHSAESSPEGTHLHEKKEENTAVWWDGGWIAPHFGGHYAYHWANLQFFACHLMPSAFNNEKWKQQVFPQLFLALVISETKDEKVKISTRKIIQAFIMGTFTQQVEYLSNHLFKGEFNRITLLSFWWKTLPWRSEMVVYLLELNFGDDILFWLSETSFGAFIRLFSKIANT